VKLMIERMVAGRSGPSSRAAQMHGSRGMIAAVEFASEERSETAIGEQAERGCQRGNTWCKSWHPRREAISVRRNQSASPALVIPIWKGKTASSRSTTTTMPGRCLAGLETRAAQIPVTLVRGDQFDQKRSRTRGLVGRRVGPSR